MLVYKNVTIGNFGEPVVIRDTGPKAQLMQAEREKEVLITSLHNQRALHCFFPINHPPKPTKNWRAFLFLKNGVSHFDGPENRSFRGPPSQFIFL